MFESTKNNEMEKQQQKPEAAGNENQEIKDTANAGTTAAGNGAAHPAVQDEALNFDEMFSFAKSTKGAEITAEYLDLSKLPPNENVIFILMGMTTFTASDGKTSPAALIMNEKKEQFILASKVVVSACERIKDECPVAIGITVKGKVKTAAGSYYDCAVVRY